ncbi:MAG: tRNA (guanosine(37)-N1)-methyltransferase TrmD [Patescibacteria group bacterium]
MKFNIITIFPRAFDSFLKTSLIARGIKKKLISVKVHDLRAWATDRHKTVDDRPYGGGPGMVIRVDVVDRSISKIKNQKSKSGKKKTRVILLEPAGKQFNQKMAERLATYDGLIFVAGHYEGVDERVRALVDEEISIGDYVLTGGELPAMVIMDTVARHISGFLGKEASLKEETFSYASGILEYPQYTRPEVHDKKRVPTVLLSGNHETIRKWRLEQAVKRTKKRRPDLLTPAAK